MVKGSFQDRSKLLFKFYDLDCTGGVSYNELLKMVCAYWFSFTVTQKKIYARWLPNKTSWKLSITISYSTFLSLNKQLVIWMSFSKQKSPSRRNNLKESNLNTYHPAHNLLKCSRNSEKKFKQWKMLKKTKKYSCRKRGRLMGSEIIDQ